MGQGLSSEEVEIIANNAVSTHIQDNSEAHIRQIRPAKKSRGRYPTSILFPPTFI